MNQTKLNANTIKALNGKIGEKVCDIEEPHLQLWVGKRTMTFYVVMKHDGRQHFIKIGSANDMTADMARIAARKTIGDIISGNTEQKRIAYTDMTLGDALDEYIESRKSERNRKIMRCALNMFCLLLNTKLSRLKREEIIKVHADNKTRPISANRAVKYVSASITMAIRRHGLKIQNVAKGIEMYAESPRSRYLSKDEGSMFKKKAIELTHHWRYGVQANAILMMLYTGARKSNVLKMRFEEIDEHYVWTIPKEKFKGGKKEHKIELGSREIEILERMRSERHESGFVFEYRGHALGEVFRTMKMICKMAGISDACIHDLRRTLGTWMLSTGAPIEVVSKKLGHSSIRVTEQVYAHMLPSVSRDATEHALDEMLGDNGKQ